MSDVAAIRERHFERTGQSFDTPKGVCAWDGTAWPCDVVTVLGFRDECERQFQEKVVLLAATPSAEPAGLVEAMNALPVLKVSGEALHEGFADMDGITGADQFFVDWDEQEWFVPLSSVVAVIEAALPTQASDSKETT